MFACEDYFCSVDATSIIGLPRVELSPLSPPIKTPGNRLGGLIPCAGVFGSFFSAARSREVLRPVQLCSPLYFPCLPVSLFF